MISNSTLKVFPAQLTYPSTKRQLLPDFRDVFPSGFGPKEPYQYPPGSSVIMPALGARARGMSAEAGAGTVSPVAQTGESGGGVVRGGQVTDTTQGPPGGGSGGSGLPSISNFLSSVGLKGRTGAIVGGIALVVIAALVILFLTKKGAGKGLRRRRGRRRH